MHLWELWPLNKPGVPQWGCRSSAPVWAAPLSKTPLHKAPKLPTAVPVWEWVSNKPGSSGVMLCANSSEALSRILFC